MRAIAIDRIMQLRLTMPRQMKQETVFLTVYLLDKMLEAYPSLSDINLVIAAALRIASKYEDIFVVELAKAHEFLRPYPKDQINEMETIILSVV